MSDFGSPLYLLGPLKTEEAHGEPHRVLVIHQVRIVILKCNYRSIKDHKSIKKFFLFKKVIEFFLKKIRYKMLRDLGKHLMSI